MIIPNGVLNDLSAVQYCDCFLLSRVILYRLDNVQIQAEP